MPKGLILKWSLHNSKVSKLSKVFGKAVTFGLPAGYSESGFTVCPGMGPCASICFAKQGHYVQGPVRAVREHNLSHARGNLRSFVRAAVSDLAKLKARLIRVHDSGDFFSQAYLNAWFRIARALPSVRFYAYTKSVRFDFSEKPSNFSITFSEGGKWDSEIDPTQSHSRIFATRADRKRAGYGDGNKTDWLAVQGKEGTKIGLVYHGVAKLTSAQERHFS